VGSIRFLDAPEPVLAFVRETGGAAMLVVFNLSSQEVSWALPGGIVPRAVDSHGLPSGTLQDGGLMLPPRGVYYALID
jgi:alpha-glucosidase